VAGRGVKLKDDPFPKNWAKSEEIFSGAKILGKGVLAS
jgi:hypothetical protein